MVMAPSAASIISATSSTSRRIQNPRLTEDRVAEPFVYGSAGYEVDRAPEDDGQLGRQILHSPPDELSPPPR